MVLILPPLSNSPRLLPGSWGLFQGFQQLLALPALSGSTTFSLLRSWLPSRQGSRKIHRPHLCRRIRRPPNEFPMTQSAGAVECTECFSAERYDHPNECPGYDTKQSDDEVRVILGLSGMLSTSSLPLLSGRLWPGVVAPDWVLSMGQIKLNCVVILDSIAWNWTVLTVKLRTYVKLNCLK